VIDGWQMWPEWVADLPIEGVASFWLSVDPVVLEEREHTLIKGMGRSVDPERMLQNFLGRSYWHNDLIHRQAERQNFPILHQDGGASVESFCELALMQLDEAGD
jgi:hypothetical protein